MDSLTKTAFIGTVKHPPQPCETGNPVDELFVSLPNLTPEKQLLLRAGARAVHQLAGRQTTPVPALESAPVVQGTPPTQRLTALLAMTLSSQSIPLLREFAGLLQSSKMTFPPSLLPSALNLQDPQRREWLRPMLGHRAKWLAQFNPQWAWIEVDSTSASDRSDLLKLLEEGTLDERLRALRSLRADDPDLARDVLAPMIVTEKGDLRRSLLAEFRTGLSVRDEDFLESFLKDRSKKVKEVAAELLSQIPASRLSRELCETGKTLLSEQQTQAGSPQLLFHLPEEIDSDAKLAWLSSTAQFGIGPRYWRAREVIARIPVSFWSEWLGKPPEEIVRLLSRTDSAAMIVSGMIQSIVHFREILEMPEWHRPLFRLAVMLHGREPRFVELLTGDLTKLVTVISPAELDESLQWLLRNPDFDVQLPFAEWARNLPSLWSPDLSDLYLQFTRKLVQTRSDMQAAGWLQTLFPAAIGLASELLNAALEPWSVNSDRQGVWRSAQLEQLLQRFGEVIRIRKEFREEITRC